MSEATLGDLPMIPPIWPLGEGVVLTGWAVEPERKLGMFLLRAVRDELVGAPGQTAEASTWDACEGAPTLCLTFKDAAAVRRHIESMTALAEAMSPQGAPDER